ncbi:MAG: hypothetical protein ACI8X5_004274, partial [Planctomycetota bacterium]
ARGLELTSRRGMPLWAVFLLSFGLGLAVDRVGDSGAINLLSFPILGLLLWNVLVYVWLFFADLLRPKHRRKAEGQASRQASSGPLARLILWCASPERFWRGELARKDTSGEVSVCVQRYMRDWFRVGAPLHLARGATWLHLAAGGVMLGAIAGMYLRGLLFHYEASWGSTFLTTDAVHSLLSFFFTPAAWTIGSPIPGVEVIDTMRAPEGSGDASLWIHYYGVTGGLLVVLPRFLLAAFSGARSKSLRKKMPFALEDDAYFLKLLAVDRGVGQRATVQPYSYRPSARSAEGLTSLLLDVLGGRTRVEKMESCEYGAHPSECPADLGSAALCRVVLFSLAQSPEHEVHGEYLAQLMRQIDNASSPCSLLVVLDRGPFLARLARGEEGTSRLAERERSWARVLSEHGLEALSCDLDGLNDPGVLERAREVIYVTNQQALES